MLTDTILHKYMRHLRYMNGGVYVNLDAAEFALRLALADLAESIPSTPSTSSAATIDPRQAEQDRAQLNRLNDWLAEHAPDTYHQPGDTAEAVLAVLNYQRTAQTTLAADLERLQTDADTEIAALKAQLAELDTDNAALIRRNKELADELHIARNGTGLVIKNPPFVPLPHVTADAPPPSTISNQQSPINNSMWSDPDMLQLLDDEATDWWIGCAAGRHQWRSVPKPVQLRMVRHILSFGPETGSMTMRDFDAIKPDWMPSASSHTQTLRLSWPQLNDWKVELEATL